MESAGLRNEMVADAHRISTQPGMYRLDPVYATSRRPEACAADMPGFSCSVGDDKDVGAESTLLGLDRPLSRFPVQAPSPPARETTEPIDIPGQSLVLAPEFRGRGSQRGVGLRWGLVEESTYHRPQCETHVIFDEPVRGGLHTRMMARDSACN
jgi:hypothetical protein